MIDRMPESWTLDLATCEGLAVGLAPLPATSALSPETASDAATRGRETVDRHRLRRLAEEPIQYVHSPEFDAPGAAEVILGPEPPTSSATLKKPPAGLPSYLRSLYRTPLLTRQQEAYLFRRYNYLKYLAAMLGRRLVESRGATSADLDRVDGYLDQAAEVKTRLVKANLRLVIHIVKRCYGSFAGFFELVSDGNLALMQAVEKFDYTRGVKFGTYAAWVIRRRFARSIPQEHCRRSHFVTGTDDLVSFSAARSVNHPDGPVDRELRSVVPQWIEDGLRQLSRRERDVIERRFGVGAFGSVQTLKEVGRELGITKERVRQIETRALAKLQRLISPEAFEVVYPGLA